MDADPLLRNVSRVLQSVEERELLDLAQALGQAGRVFVAGEGRSGMIARCFAAGLVRLGRSAFVPGEAATPAYRPGDLLLVCSASGRTPQMHLAAEEAQAQGVPIVLITAAALSPLHRLARRVILLPPLLPAAAGPVAPPLPREEDLLDHFRDLYEQAAFVFLECVRSLLAAPRIPTALERGSGVQP
jgi:6-phospho 3-hexuloisomerase